MPAANDPLCTEGFALTCLLSHHAAGLMHSKHGLALASDGRNNLSSQIPTIPLSCPPSPLSSISCTCVIFNYIFLENAKSSGRGTCTNMLSREQYPCKDLWPTQWSVFTRLLSLTAWVDVSGNFFSTQGGEY